MQLELLETLELGKIGHEWSCTVVPRRERFESVPNTKLNMDEAGENFSFAACISPWACKSPGQVQ